MFGPHAAPRPPGALPSPPGPTGARGQRITAVMNRCTDVKSDIGQGLAGARRAEAFFLCGRHDPRVIIGALDLVLSFICPCA